MGDVVVVGNTKGGVGKTALTFNVAWCLAERGVRVLVVDFDVQCGQAAFLRDALPDADHDAGAVLMRRVAVDSVLHSPATNLDVLPANEYSMSHISRRLEHDSVRARAHALFADMFDDLRTRWDVVLVDTAGHQSPLLGFALSAADGVVIPVSPEAGPVAELPTVLNLVEHRRGAGGRPRVLGIVRTRVWGNAVYRRVSEEQIRAIAADRRVRLYRNKVPEDAKFGEAHLLGVAVNEHHRRARSAVAYRFLADEMLDAHGWVATGRPTAPEPLG